MRIQKVLNVGGGPDRNLPALYKGWQQLTLDIDPAVQPDVLCDAKEMHKLKRESYDAIFCSHNLEHFYRHEVPQVLRGFQHVLRPDGFVDIRVPNMTALFEAIRDRDINDTYYTVPAGNISFHDVLYGWGKQVSNGNLYYSHKTGFTEKSLIKVLRDAKFKRVMTATDDLNIYAYGFKGHAPKSLLQRLGI